MIPLFKNRGRAEDPSNYRPVSLLPAPGKALHKIQSQHLAMVDQQLISPHQFGFIPGKSTVIQLLYLTEKWYRALERYMYYRKRGSASYIVREVRSVRVVGSGIKKKGGVATTHRCILRCLTQLGFEALSVATTQSIAWKTGRAVVFLARSSL